jgi:hypothetical protein
MIRVVLPGHLRTLARVNAEVQLDIKGPVTQRSVLDARSCDSSPARKTIPSSRRILRCLTPSHRGRSPFSSLGPLPVVEGKRSCSFLVSREAVITIR